MSRKREGEGSDQSKLFLRISSLVYHPIRRYFHWFLQSAFAAVRKEGTPAHVPWSDLHPLVPGGVASPPSLVKKWGGSPPDPPSAHFSCRRDNGNGSLTAQRFCAGTKLFPAYITTVLGSSMPSAAVRTSSTVSTIIKVSSLLTSSGTSMRSRSFS